MNQTAQSNQTLLDGICRRGVLVATSVRYWRGCKKLSAEDLGLDPAHDSERLIQLGHKRLIPRDALQAFALIESRVQATVESSSFPFLGGIGRFVPNARLGDLTDKLEKLRDEFRDATLDFVAGYSPLRENAMTEWREAARHLNGSAERLIATIEQSFPPAGEIAKRFAFETRLFQIAAPDSIRLEVVEGVHQRTLNRLTTFIDSFRTLNFAGDQQLEQTLERFRRDLLSRSAEEYRNQPGAMASLTDGLSRLRENAVQLARSDAREVISRFGQMGTRRLAAVG